MKCSLCKGDGGGGVPTGPGSLLHAPGERMEGGVACLCRQDVIRCWSGTSRCDGIVVEVPSSIAISSSVLWRPSPASRPYNIVRNDAKTCQRSAQHDSEYRVEKHDWVCYRMRRRVQGCKDMSDNCLMRQRQYKLSIVSSVSSTMTLLIHFTRRCNTLQHTATHNCLMRQRI